MNNFVASVFFTDKAKELNDNFYLTLDDVVNSYPNAKIKPDQYTNNADYVEALAALIRIQSEYFMFNNDVVKESEALMKYGHELDKKITVLEDENKHIEAQLADMESSGHSAEGLLDDAQTTRNQLFFENIILFVMVVGGGYFFYKRNISLFASVSTSITSAVKK